MFLFGVVVGSDDGKRYIRVVVSNIFYFHLYLGKIPMLTNIFQMGWNHQLVMFSGAKSLVFHVDDK